MAAPIISNERVIGVFDLESDSLDAYEDDDLAVLELLASHVAIIIEKREPVPTERVALERSLNVRNPMGVHGTSETTEP
jgi:GAF domain-containing protein